MLNVFAVTAVVAQQTEIPRQRVSKSEGSVKAEVKSRSGYDVDTDVVESAALTSVSRRLYLDDIFIAEKLRFPEWDERLQPYYEWKRGLVQKHGLQLGTDYTSLFQKASDSLTSHDSAAGGVYRFYGRWVAFNNDSKNTGSLVFKVENSHNYGDRISPVELAGEIGYLGSTGLLYSDNDLVLNDFNWQQYFNDGQAEFIVGRLDVNDYMDVVDYANPWTTFQNSNILENHSIAIPDTSVGFNLSSWLNNHWYLKAAIIDANGKLNDIVFLSKARSILVMPKSAGRQMLQNES